MKKYSQGFARVVLLILLIILLIIISSTAAYEINSHSEHPKLPELGSDIQYPAFFSNFNTNCEGTYCVNYHHILDDNIGG